MHDQLFDLVFKVSELSGETDHASLIVGHGLSDGYKKHINRYQGVPSPTINTIYF